MSSASEHRWRTDAIPPIANRSDTPPITKSSVTPPPIAGNTIVPPPMETGSPVQDPISSRRENQKKGVFEVLSSRGTKILAVSALLTVVGAAAKNIFSGDTESPQATARAPKEQSNPTDGGTTHDLPAATLQQEHTITAESPSAKPKVQLPIQLDLPAFPAAALEDTEEEESSSEPSTAQHAEQSTTPQEVEPKEIDPTEAVAMANEEAAPQGEESPYVTLKETELQEAEQKLKEHFAKLYDALDKAPDSQKSAAAEKIDEELQTILSTNRELIRDPLLATLYTERFMLSLAAHQHKDAFARLQEMQKANAQDGRLLFTKEAVTEKAGLLLKEIEIGGAELDQSTEELLDSLVAHGLQPQQRVLRTKATLVRRDAANTKGLPLLQNARQLVNIADRAARYGQDLEDFQFAFAQVGLGEGLNTVSSKKFAEEAQRTREVIEREKTRYYAERALENGNNPKASEWLAVDYYLQTKRELKPEYFAGASNHPLHAAFRSEGTSTAEILKQADVVFEYAESVDDTQKTILLSHAQKMYKKALEMDLAGGGDGHPLSEAFSAEATSTMDIVKRADAVWDHAQTLEDTRKSMLQSYAEDLYAQALTMNEMEEELFDFDLLRVKKRAKQPEEAPDTSQVVVDVEREEEGNAEEEPGDKKNQILPKEWNDVAALMELNNKKIASNTIQGTWSIAKTGEIIGSSNERGLVKIPIAIEKSDDGHISYELVCDFMRTGGNGAIVFQIPVGTNMAQLILEDGFSGIDQVDNIRFHRGPYRVETKYPNNMVMKVHIKIDVDPQENASISCQVNGRPVSKSFLGKTSRLSLPDDWNNDSIALGLHDSTVAFKNLQIKTNQGSISSVD